MLQELDFSKLLVLDIETVPQYELYSQVPENFKELWAQKTTFQRQEQSPEEFYKRAGIWAEFGKIICISFGRIVKKQSTEILRIKTFSGHDEKQLLTDFSNLLNTLPESAILAAHNGKEFDFPYICRRLLINNLTIPKILQIGGKKPWEINHIDTLELWKFGDYKNYISLNLLAAVFNISTPKEDIDGSQVASIYYNEKNLARIVEYCQKDVITTMQILFRFKNLPSIDPINIQYIT